MLMSSGSAAYFVFVAVVFFSYWASYRSVRLRLAVLLLANYLFCARFGLFYVALLPACAAIDYTVGLGLMRFRRNAVRRALLAVSLALNLGVLVGSRHAGALLGAKWTWVFPLGLSFYTFQSLTYTLDLYRRDAEGTRGFLEYLCAASFFPTLQAGPITRLADLTKQLRTSPFLTREEGGRAFFLIASGLLKKALIADFLADNLVNRVFDTPNLYSGAEVLIAVYAYSLQLYYDFSGYTDIARGAALLLGIRLPSNFDRPYTATNLTDFWRRWHITFSNWLRDYLYFALPGARTKVMPYVNLVITMLLGGLWHGLTWTFAIWGLLHGAALAATRAWLAHRRHVKRPATRWGTALAIAGTWHFVCLTWIFFRASSPANAWQILSRIGSLTAGFGNVPPLLTAVLLLGAAGMLVRKEWHVRAVNLFAAAPFYVHAAALVLVAIVLQTLGGRGSVPFVYSRF
jgi:D-alanyl-lipoteichoic acid acyltransferase DltB (MBOAT superfamily)